MLLLGYWEPGQRALFILPSLSLGEFRGTLPRLREKWMSYINKGLLGNECLCPLNSYIEILTPKMMILGSGNLGGDLIIRALPS